ncbi:MAG: citrate transporter [Lacrimispora sp.]|uniref:citrate transporter n=1 Tax=Lacrimispora sp. TaxID=2719234 RepID=UPI0039E6031D
MSLYIIIAGILLLVSFAGLIVYCMRGGNLLVGFIFMALVWSIIGRVPYRTVVDTVFQASVENYGPTIAIIVFGSWFGRVIVDTGIAGFIIKKTVELAGDKPLVTTLMVSIVCTLIFTSAFGVGSVMAIGMIVLPILFSLNVEKHVAVGSYLMSVAAGMYLNIGYVNQLLALFPSMAYDNVYIRFGIAATVVHVVFMLIFIVFHYSKGKRSRAWAATPAAPVTKPIPGIAAIIPFLPIFMVAIFKWKPVPSFLLGIFLGLLLTGNMATYKMAIEKVQKTLYDGIADVGLLIGMLYGVNIFSTAAKQVSPILSELLGGVIPQAALVIVIIFIIAAPLGLFRGPLMVFGSGAATLAILQATGFFTDPFLFILFLVPPVAIVANSCPTQSWSMWGISYAKMEAKAYIRTNFPWSWVIFAVNLLIGYFLIGR